jgi:plasmid stabilization system protein ParE
VGETELRLHPEAADEAERVRAWYAARGSAVGLRFLRELDSAMGAVRESPDRWPELWRGFRRFALPSFPISVVYRQRSNVIEVVAIAHHRRRPGYWRSRT